MPTEVLFTIAILVRKNPHLLPLTLESLASQAKSVDYEVIVLNPLKSGKVAETAHRFSMPLQVIDGKGTDADLMNQAVEKARGRYVQFLFPGDRYLSQQALSYLTELIRDSQEPQLVYCAFLQRDWDRPPQAVSFPLNLQTLRKGIFQTMYRSSWFLKQAIVESGGFDRRLTYRPSFDLLCRMFLKPQMRAVYSRRVLTDYEPSKNTPRKIAGYAAETCRILYRHFGAKAAVRWLFVQDNLRILRWTWQLLKEAFQRKD